MARKKFDISTLSKYPDLKIEKRLWKKGWKDLGGIDEAGRGALAGPVSAAVVILPNISGLTRILAGVRDSKQMTVNQRNLFEPLIKEISLSWSVGFASPAEIDEIGILPATRLAAKRAVENLSLRPAYLITDYLNLPDIDIPQEKFIKGDMRSLTIASASVLAKTARDAEMCLLDEQVPGYELSRHKGYGTRLHREAIQKLGKSSIHRQSFKLKK
ncbi:MAG: ribonuclease HII [Anaerolineae bacterium]|jgi:ribonuclease HII|nr:ribonuclease HII [Anaerolineae bacterium]MBT3714521.1 ribonuclease HII [Anaerolineae bacterium]MBT4308909.1 ribonuclease HII [Anaerolineae bacterium]MBT4459060.1 ribonuclease HII [Anaerolineae bacterium]MBT6061219.1 ribonuclease HII [Anaerolineae bacterium]